MIPPTYLIKTKINRPDGWPPKLKITPTEIIILHPPESRHSFFVGKPHILFNVSHGKKGKKTVGVGLFVHILYKYLSHIDSFWPLQTSGGSVWTFQINDWHRDSTPLTKLHQVDQRRSTLRQDTMRCLTFSKRPFHTAPWKWREKSIPLGEPRETSPSWTFSRLSYELRRLRDELKGKKDGRSRGGTEFRAQVCWVFSERTGTMSYWIFGYHVLIFGYPYSYHATKAGW